MTGRHQRRHCQICLRQFGHVSETKAHGVFQVSDTEFCPMNNTYKNHHKTKAQSCRKCRPDAAHVWLSRPNFRHHLFHVR